MPHLVSEFPTHHISIWSSLRKRSSSPVVVVGTLDDATTTKLVRLVAASSGTMHLASYITLNAAMTQAEQDAQAMLLYGHSLYRMGDASDRPITVVPAIKDNKELVEETVAAVVKRMEEQAPGTRIVRPSSLAADATSRTKPASLASMRRINALIDHADNMAIPEMARVSTKDLASRNYAVAVQAVASLLQRGASQNEVGQHLRAYAYTTRERKFGVWPVTRVRAIITEATAAIDGAGL